MFLITKFLHLMKIKMYIPEHMIMMVMMMMMKAVKMMMMAMIWKAMMQIKRVKML